MEEEDIKTAVQFLLKKEKTVAEPAGAIGVGAVMRNPPHMFEGKNVAIVITGGNIDGNLI